MTGAPNEVEQIAATEFTRRFGTAPAWVASASGRVNLIGDHTDYAGGLVLPLAIDRRCAVAGGIAPGDASEIISMTERAPLRVDLRAALSPGGAGWSRYVLGVAHHMKRHARGGCNVRAVIASDVPLGAGLSSSASLEVACATLLERAWDGRVSSAERAAACRAAEHEFAGVPCGIMDQLIACVGRAGHAVRIDCRDGSMRDVALPAQSVARLVVVNTRVRHDLAAGEYAARRAACERAAAVLGVPLRDATMPLARSLTDAASRRMAEHVVSENARVLEAAAALEAGDLTRAGSLMLASHASLRDSARVSCPELDWVVEHAAARPGVFGVRMTGGGFGGCAIALATAAGAAGLHDEMPGAFAARFGGACEVFEVRASDGATVRAWGSGSGV